MSFEVCEVFLMKMRHFFSQENVFRITCTRPSYFNTLYLNTSLMLCVIGYAGREIKRMHFHLFAKVVPDEKVFCYLLVAILFLANGSLGLKVVHIAQPKFFFLWYDALNMERCSSAAV